MDLIMDFVRSPAGIAAISLAIGAAVSFVITKWALEKSEKTELRVAAAGIKGAAERLVSIDGTTRELLQRFEEGLQGGVVGAFGGVAGAEVTAEGLEVLVDW